MGHTQAAFFGGSEMEGQVNAWLERNPDAEILHASLGSARTVGGDPVFRYIVLYRNRCAALRSRVS